MAMPVPENIPEARVLVVDDEANIVELLSVSLKFQGFEVHTASNGPAALDKAREVRPDAIILDVMMPGMDGFGLLRRLRADGIDAPALFLTARDSLQDKIAGLTRAHRREREAGEGSGEVHLPSLGTAQDRIHRNCTVTVQHISNRSDDYW